MTTKEMIDVMQAYDEGKQIQCRSLTEISWRDIVKPVWNWDITDYRIKPEPKYRPYKDTNELFADYKEKFKSICPDYAIPLIWVQNIHTDWQNLIIGYSNNMFVRIFNNSISMNELFEAWTYLDGSRCGKLVEENV